MNMSGLGGDSKYAAKAPKGSPANRCLVPMPMPFTTTCPASGRGAPPPSAKRNPASGLPSDNARRISRNRQRCRSRRGAQAPGARRPACTPVDRPGRRGVGDLYDQGYVYVQVDNGNG